MTDGSEADTSRLVTWRDPLAATNAGGALAGHEFLRAMMTGGVPNPPFGELLRMSVTAVQQGRVQFTCHPDGSMYNATGTVHGGILCTLLDTAASCAVLSALPQGKSILSIEIKVNYLSAVRTVDTAITATGTIDRLGSRIAFATASAADDSGRIIANATSSVMIVNLP